MTHHSAEPDGLRESLLTQLEHVQLRLHGEAALVGADETDPGTLDWNASAYISIFADEDEGNHPWHAADGVALARTTRNSDHTELVMFEADGLIVDLQHVDDVFDALDARSQDYADFIPIFGRTHSFGILNLVSDLEETLEPGGNRVVIVDRVRLAPAWRGLGGVGRLLTGRLLRWVCDDPQVVVVHPFPTELDQDALDDPAVFDPAMQRVRQVWASLGFERHTDDIWFMDPRLTTHSDALAAFARRLRL
ncbi:hypothetical protein [Kibdelosporangium phytohabitans]|uniref:hypothetical protein n=1 Tax=Kibdelosporangium phytohabitans TaxID=860235 RepID=UPI0012FB650D|nr:hypothetical protein [Kibdelosporangium phytohabitans]MBE1467427.1 hypothetical protein [Kibdelosporangium phytohabitans]